MFHVHTNLSPMHQVLPLLPAGTSLPRTESFHHIPGVAASFVRSKRDSNPNRVSAMGLFGRSQLQEFLRFGGQLEREHPKRRA